MEQAKEIKRNCMTMMQGHKLINYISSLADDGKIKMTASKIAESSEQAIGMTPSKQSVQKFCRELDIEYDHETRSGANGRGRMKLRVDALEAEVAIMDKRISTQGRLIAELRKSPPVV